MKSLRRQDQKPLTERMLQVVQYVFEHPEANQTQVAKHFNLSITRIRTILGHKRVLAAYPVMARNRIKNMVPKAVKRMGELMEQTENLEVSRKVTERVLETEKVLESEPSVQVNVYQTLPDNDLKQMLDAHKIKAEAIDAEVVDTPHSPPTK